MASVLKIYQIWPNTPQKHLEIPQVPVAILVIDTIGCLPVTSRGHQCTLTTLYKHISYVFAIPVKEKSAEKVQTYLTGIVTHKGGSVAILSDNGTELKKTQYLMMLVKNWA